MKVRESDCTRISHRRTVHFRALPSSSSVAFLSLVHQLSTRTRRAKIAPPAIPETSMMEYPVKLSATELKAPCGVERKEDAQVAKGETRGQRPMGLYKENFSLAYEPSI